MSPRDTLERPIAPPPIVTVGSVVVEWPMASLPREYAGPCPTGGVLAGRAGIVAHQPRDASRLSVWDRVDGLSAAGQPGLSDRSR